MKNFVAALTVRFVDRLSRPARSAASAIGQIERAQKMAARAGEQWSQGMERLDRRLNRLASASLVVDGIGRAGQAMVAPLRRAVTEGSNFNQAMTGIGITAQLTDGQLAPLRDTILKTASDIGALPTVVQATFGAVLAQGVYRTEQELSRAGVAVARFQRLQATMGEPLSDTEAGAFSAAMGRSLKLRADQLDRVNAMANRSAQQGSVSGAGLARALPSQTGSLVGFDFANRRGLADLMTANQLAGGQAGSTDIGTNNISNLMASIASPETLRRFDEAGIHLEAAIKTGVTRGISPLETIAQITRDATSGDQFRIGELFGDRQARDGLMAIVQQFDKFKADSRELQGDDVMKSYLADLDRAAKGPAASFARYTANVSRAGIATGTILAPAVGVAAGVLGRLAGWMSRTAESGGLLGKVAVYAVAGLAGIAVGAGAIGHAVIGILGPLFILNTLIGPGGLGGAAVRGGLANVVGMLGRVRLAAVGVNLAFLGNPIVLAIAAVVAVAVIAAVLIRRNWGTVGPWLAGVWRGISGAAQRGIGLVRGYIMNFTPLGFLIRNWGPIVNFFSAVWGAAKAVVGLAFDGIKYLVLRFTPLGFIVRNWSPITGFLSTLWNGAQTVVSASLSAIRSAIANFGPLNAFKAAFAGVWSWLAELPGRMLNAGADAVRGFTRGVQGQRAAVQAATARVGGAAETGVRDRLAIRSPSRVFMALGDYAMAGLSIGLDRGSRRPLASMAAVSAALATSLPGAAGTASFGGAGTAGQTAAAASAGPVSIAKLEQHFHLPAGSPDVREIARELKRLGDQGVRRALSDAVAS